MQSTLFQQGMDLLVFGMGTVFVFLTLLVFCVTLMSKIIGKFFAEEAVVVNQSDKAPLAPTSVVDSTTLAIIQDAIYQHRAKHKP